MILLSSIPLIAIALIGVLEYFFGGVYIDNETKEVKNGSLTKVWLRAKELAPIAVTLFGLALFLVLAEYVFPHIV